MKKNKSTILALDISSSSTGYVVFKNGRWGKAKNSYGTICTNSKDLLSERLVSFRDDLVSLLNRVKPSIIIIEDVFSGPNVSTMKTLSRFSGVGMEACQRVTGKPPHIVLTASVRSFLKCGRSKQEAFDFVCSRYNLDWKFNQMNDIADAVCLALYARSNFKDN